MHILMLLMFGLNIWDNCGIQALTCDLADPSVVEVAQLFM